ncbi:hypothetical protein WS57_21810 [Burkholderia pseudomultivorans]|nr:hypothetical protein WS57_21810 [Burkholderia pseudomultivorans]
MTTSIPCLSELGDDQQKYTSPLETFNRLLDSAKRIEQMFDNVCGDDEIQAVEGNTVERLGVDFA